MSQKRKTLYQNAKGEISESDLDGATLVRSNRRGKTCVLLLDGKVEVVLKFPTSEELVQFTELFLNRKYA